MAEIIRLLLVPAIFALGVAVSRRNLGLASAITCRVGVFCLAIWAILLPTGLGHQQSVAGMIHRVAGVGFTTPIWLGAFFALGVGIQQAQARGGVLCLARVAVILFALLVSIVSSFTGYMGPSRDPELPIDSYHRFVVLHQIVAPTILFILLCLWVWLFWPRNTDSQQLCASEENTTAHPQS